jgi:uncharacterized protein (TIGR03435 family)
MESASNWPKGGLIPRIVRRSGLWAVACSLAFGQSPLGTTFEVASVKLSPPVPPTGGVYFGPPRGGPGTPDPEQITWSYATLKGLLTTAYDVKAYQVDGPVWLDTERYDIMVKVPAGATKERVGVMWQNLLAERFGVVLHHESKEFQVEELSVAKGGPKLKETTWDPSTPLQPGPPQVDKSGDPAGPGQVQTIRPGENGMAYVRMAAKAQPIAQLASTLGFRLDRPVLDKTGLTGKYDYTIEFTTDIRGLVLPRPGQPAPPPATELGLDFATAVQQELGLKLTRAKAMLDVLVIDKAEKVPTKN